jgi:hypothetical protein
MTKTLSARVTEEEWTAFRAVCRKNNVKVQDLLHGMIVDALMDEDYVLQCRRQERCQTGRETGEAMGATET